MRWPVIHKLPRADEPSPNLADYAQTCRTFTWQSARAELDGLPGGGLNIAHEAVVRHARGPRRDHVALRWLGKQGERRDLTYGELDEQSSRFANALERLGVRAGDRIYTLLGRVPELYVAALGTLKHRAVLCPLFSAFGPDPVATRLRLGSGRVLVTSRRLYERKVASVRAGLPELAHVILVGEGEAPGTLDFAALCAAASPAYAIGPTDAETPALLHFTSGTTGTPKGAVHVHEAVVMHHLTGKLALDLHPEDIFWCTADPGWVTGTSYGIIAPLTRGVTMVIDEGELDPARWYEILERERVTVFYTAPTAIRMLMKAGRAPLEGRDLRHVRFLASVGGGVVSLAIHHTDRLSVEEIMNALVDLVKRARAGTFRGSELTDGTITVSSLGDRGVETLWPIIYPPQVAIVGVGTILERPWVVGGAVVPRPLAQLTLAADHRVTDGHRGALFLRALKAALESPGKP
jgi:acetyl-CoA synthetase